MMRLAADSAAYTSIFAKNYREEKVSRSMATRFSIEYFEHMTTHELADLLSLIVLLLRRLPDLSWLELQSLWDTQAGTDQQHPQAAMHDILKELCVADLREIAEDLHMPLPSRIKKEDLITKILVRQERQTHEHQQRYAMQEQ